MKGIREAAVGEDTARIRNATQTLQNTMMQISSASTSPPPVPRAAHKPARKPAHSPARSRSREAKT